MRFVVYDDYRLGVLRDDLVYDLSRLLPPALVGSPVAMNYMIENFHHYSSALRDFGDDSAAIDISTVRLLPPVPTPTHIFAAPLNYRAHVAEMDGSAIVHSDFSPSNARDLGFFLKAPGSLVGQSGAILLPNLPGRSFHHESELCAVIGRATRAVPAESALECVFGYTCLMDITLRNTPDVKNERAMRKSFETFTPLGPALVTADEIHDPGSLEIRLAVNGETRQSANTRELIVPISELISDASKVLTLKPGDLYATGTPEGVGPITAGDHVTMFIERVGELDMEVLPRPW